MRPGPFGLVAAIVFFASTAAAQSPCGWNQIWLDTEQTGAVEPTDCPVQPFRNGVGDEWRLSLNAGDLITLQVLGGTLRDAYLIAIDPSNAIVAATNDLFDGDRTRWIVVRAAAAGTYRILVTAGGLYSADFGTYTFRSSLIIYPTAPYLPALTIEREKLIIGWHEPLSPTPILEYLLEIGVDAGAGNQVTVFSVVPSTQPPWTLFELPIARGLYSVRVRARNALGWGPVSDVRQLRYPRERLPPNLSWYAYPSLGYVHLDIGAVQDPKPTFYELLAGSASGLADVGTLMVPVAGWSTPLDFYNVPSGRYYVRVREWGPEGPGPVSEEKIIDIY